MNLHCETILVFYTLKNIKVLCQIKVSSKSRKMHNTCRCLTQEQWIAFDKELEKVLTAQDYLKDVKCIKFYIKPHIEVQLQKSKVSFKHFHKLLDTNSGYNQGDVTGVTEHNLVLECKIDYQQAEVLLPSSTASHEYEPDGKSNSQLYEPYTPAKKKIRGVKIDSIKNIGMNFLECNDATYSPEPVSKIGAAIETNLSQTVPKYIPAPINLQPNCKEMSTFNFHDETLIETDSTTSSRSKCKSLRSKLKKKSKRTECEYIPKCQEVAVLDIPIYIPTPIEGTASQKVCETVHIRKNKKRSITIDAYPERLEENNEKQILKKEQLDSQEKSTPWYSIKSKKRSMTIDEIPPETADVPVYIPTPIEETKHQKILESFKFDGNGKSSIIDMLPEIRFQNTKENHLLHKEQIGNKNKYIDRQNNLKIRSTTIDEIPVALSESNMIHMANLSQSKEQHYLNEQFSTQTEKNIPLDKKSEHIPRIYSLSENKFTASLAKTAKEPSITQIKASDIRLKDPNKIDKTISLQQLNLHPSIRDIPSQKTIKDKKIEAKATETTKSFRRSERSSSKHKILNEEQPKPINKNTLVKQKISPKNKELFGTDDDDDDEAPCFKTNMTFCETPVSKKIVRCSSNSSTNKKHVKNKTSENFQLKRDENERLSQKKLTSLAEETKKSSKATKMPLSSETLTQLKSQKCDNDLVNCEKSLSPTFELYSMQEKRKRKI